MDFFGQQSYEDQDQRPLPVGALADDGDRDIITAVNDDPRAKQVSTLTVANYAAAKVYSFSIDGVARSYIATAADANNAGVAVQIAALINADPLFNGRIVATANAAVVTLTARLGGVGFTLAGGADLAAAAVTASATAAPVGFGRLVVSDGMAENNLVRLGKLAQATSLTAQAVTLTPAAVNAATCHVDVTVDGHTYRAQYKADADATVKEIVEGLAAVLNGLLPASTVAATEDDASLTLTAEVAGLPFAVACGSDNAAATWEIADNSDGTTDINQAALGVSIYVYTVEVGTDGSVGYAPGTPMSVLKRGRITVATEDAPSLASPVYVRLADPAATGEPIGGFRGSAAAGCVRLAGARWSRIISTSRAVLDLDR